MRKFTKISSVVFLLLSVLCILLFPTANAQDEAAAPSSVSMTVLNVGKADCILIFCDGKTYLVDTGYEFTFGALKTALEEYQITHIDGVFVTHTHVDHSGGLVPLASDTSVTVEHIYAPMIFYEMAYDSHPALTYSQKTGVPLTWLSAGDTIPVSDTAAFTVLGPLTQNKNNENNNSLVMRLDTAQGSILLTGDMKAEEEATLVKAEADLSADVLKVGHHGDSGASSDALIKQVLPQVAVISTSTAEESDTPAPSVLKRLASYNALTCVTQDYVSGVTVELQDGKATAYGFAWNDRQTGFSGKLGASIDLANDILTLKNLTDEDISVGGWAIYSSRGDDTYFLADGLILPANGQLLIGSKTTKIACDTKLPDKKVWHQSKSDTCLVMDACGHLAVSTDNGL